METQLIYTLTNNFEDFAYTTNNKTVRDTLISRGITPENLPPEEDVKKVERKLNSDNKKSLKNNKGFQK